MKGTHAMSVIRSSLGICLFLLCSACSGANSEPPVALDPDEVEDAGSAPDQSRPVFDQGSARSTLVINEVAPHGTDTDKDPDYIEIYNGGSGQVNLGGYQIRDDGSTWSELPMDAVIPAGGFYVINCDDLSMTSTLPGAHVAFKLGGSGDEVHLASPDGTELGMVRWGSGSIEVPKGQSLGRKPDTSGPFVVLEKPTRGRPNS